MDDLGDCDSCPRHASPVPVCVPGRVVRGASSHSWDLHCKLNVLLEDFHAAIVLCCCGTNEHKLSGLTQYSFTVLRTLRVRGWDGLVGFLLRLSPGCRQDVGCCIRGWSSGSSCKLTPIGRIQFLAVVGLRSPVPC